MVWNCRNATWTGGARREKYLRRYGTCHVSNAMLNVGAPSVLNPPFWLLYFFACFGGKTNVKVVAQPLVYSRYRRGHACRDIVCIPFLLFIQLSGPAQFPSDQKIWYHGMHYCYCYLLYTSSEVTTIIPVDLAPLKHAWVEVLVGAVDIS